MRAKWTAAVVAVLLGMTLIAQDIQHDVAVINIEVPVRVYSGNRFVANLTIDDFELFENGNKQIIEAVYLISKTDIQRREMEDRAQEAGKNFAPLVSRNFVLLFEMFEYFPNWKGSPTFFSGMSSVKETAYRSSPRPIRIN